MTSSFFLSRQSQHFCVSHMHHYHAGHHHAWPGPCQSLQTLPLSHVSLQYPVSHRLALRPLQHAHIHLGPSTHLSHLPGVLSTALLMMGLFPLSCFGFKDTFAGRPVQVIPLLSTDFTSCFVTNWHPSWDASEFFFDLLSGFPTRLWTLQRTVFPPTGVSSAPSIWLSKDLLKEFMGVTLAFGLTFGLDFYCLVCSRGYPREKALPSTTHLDSYLSPGARLPPQPHPHHSSLFCVSQTKSIVICPVHFAFCSFNLESLPPPIHKTCSFLPLSF